ncbi:hypothetical protein MtrunA17_Chr4g0029091 [Medicago truncatula]|uniref:Uncharacterized protein n=1 Tax=Medicago truncatula TaxID=3880 RepID=A0A396I7E3_MEDTR|nr:hypothetical protein MtrunA17_Chr4g0029091 [Medicago truncatula]
MRDSLVSLNFTKYINLHVWIRKHANKLQSCQENKQNKISYE